MKPQTQATIKLHYQKLPKTGKGTFACYVDGMAYIVEKHQINSYYQYTQDYYAFVVNGVKKTKPIFSIVIGSSAEALI